MWILTDTKAFNCQMEESLSPAPATTAEEAMASSDDHGERGVSPGENSASSRDTQCPAVALARREEAAPEVEQWAAAVPPVSNEACPGLFSNTGLMPFLNLLSSSSLFPDLELTCWYDETCLHKTCDLTATRYPTFYRHRQYRQMLRVEASLCSKQTKALQIFYTLT